MTFENKIKIIIMKDRNQRIFEMARKSQTFFFLEGIRGKQKFAQMARGNII